MVQLLRLIGYPPEPWPMEGSNLSTARFAAAIFDFDETMVDLEPQHKAAEIALCRELGSDWNDLPDRLRNASGLRITEMLGEMKAHFSWHPSVEELSARRQELFTGEWQRVKVEPMPGVQETVEDLYQKGLRLAVASSGVREYIEGVLDRLDLRKYFTVVISGESVTRAKPDPEAYLVTCEKLGVEPARSVVFEDSHVGVLSAKRAGAFCVGVANPRARQKQDLSAADLVVPSLKGFRLEEIGAAVSK